MMKNVLSIMVLVLVLTTPVVPSLAQESRGDAVIPDGMPPQLWEIITGRDGFSIYDAHTLSANYSGTDLAKPEGMPLQVWRVINSRDGFSIYDPQTLRAKASASMPQQLWRVITSRDGFNIYATDNLVAESLGNDRARPDGIPSSLWQIVVGRDGFNASSGCLAC
jgi:hypothetical protein